jgi:ubiquinone biosynthesis protein UbiJ
MQNFGMKCKARAQRGCEYRATQQYEQKMHFMFKPIATRFLQHLTSQNQWSKPYLVPFAGKVVQFDFVLFQLHVQILEDGSLAIAADNYNQNAAPEAIIHLPPSLALRIMAGDEAAKMQVSIEGDTHFATELSKVLQHMRWDIEEDLSHFTGDIAASKIGSTSKKILHTAKQQTINAAEMLSEYWQEEKNILAKKRHVETFNAEVDALVGDVARFEKRLQKLVKNLDITQSKESTHQ